MCCVVPYEKYDTIIWFSGAIFRYSLLPKCVQQRVELRFVCCLSLFAGLAGIKREKRQTTDDSSGRIIRPRMKNDTTVIDSAIMMLNYIIIDDKTDPAEGDKGDGKEMDKKNGTLSFAVRQRQNLWSRESIPYD